MKKIFCISVLGFSIWSFTLLPITNYQLPAVYAGHRMVGTTGAQFLKIGIGARPIGMGGTYAGIADDVNTIYWNPAGLAQIKGKELSAQHIVWFQEVNYEYLAYAQPIGNLGTFGLAISYLYLDDIERRETDTDTPIDTFRAADGALTLAYGKKLSKNLLLGVNLKYIYQTIYDKIAQGAAVDLGALYQFTSKLQVGLVAQNLGTPIEFIEQSDPLPLNIKLGVGYKLLKDKLTLGLDVNYPMDNNLNANIGAEYNLKFGNFSFPIRAGYKTLNDFKTIDGLGVGLGFSWTGYALDIAWVPYGDLGNTYRVSLKIKSPAPAVVAPQVPAVTPEPAPAPAPVVVPQPPAEPIPVVPPGERVNIAIMDLRGQGISDYEAIVISDLLRNAVVNTNIFQVVERGNIDKIMAELGYQQTGCTDQECALKIGKLLNAQKSLVGTIGKLGGIYIITIRVVDVEKGVVEYSDKERSATLEDTEQAVETLARRLVTNLKR